MHSFRAMFYLALLLIYFGYLVASSVLFFTPFRHSFSRRFSIERSRSCFLNFGLNGFLFSFCFFLLHKFCGSPA